MSGRLCGAYCAALVHRLFLRGLLVCASLFLGLVTPAHAGVGYWEFASPSFGPHANDLAPCNALHTTSLIELAECARAELEYLDATCSTTYTINAVVHGVGTRYTSGVNIKGYTASNCSAVYGTASTIIDTPVSCAGGQAWQSSTGECPKDCGMFSGQSHRAFYTAATVNSPACAAIPGGESDDCAVNVDGGAICNGGECVGTFTYTGGGCTSEPEITPREIDPPSNHDCISADGLSLCVTSNRPNCGTVNGEYMCLPTTGSCSAAGVQGAVVCESSAPHAPTQGDGVTPATPDGSFVGRAQGGSTTNNYNYYTAGTVGASGTPVTTGGSGSLPGEPADDEEAEVPEFVGREMHELEGFGPATSAFFAEVEGTELGALTLGVADKIPEGACPEPSFEAFGETFTFTAHCTLVDEMGTALAVLMLGLWGVLALRIILSA